jgi:hypothetical protein
VWEIDDFYFCGNMGAAEAVPICPESSFDVVLQAFVGDKKRYFFHVAAASFTVLGLLYMYCSWFFVEM